LKHGFDRADTHTVHRAIAFALLLPGVALAVPAGPAVQSEMFSPLAQERVIGLVNLPDVIGDTCGPDKPGSVDLFKTPSAGMAPIGSIRFVVAERAADGSSCSGVQVLVRHAESGSDEELPTQESDYEIRAAVVYQRSGIWFRIALQRGSAWIKRDDPKDFRSYPELLTQKLSYLAKGWDGRLSRTPQAVASRVPAEWAKYLEDDIPVEVLDVRRARNDIWIHVRLQTESCGETRAGVSPISGWVRAYRPSGRTSVWFHSRGC
jgi:hypothetical protein